MKSAIGGVSNFFEPGETKNRFHEQTARNNIFRFRERNQRLNKAMHADADYVNLHDHPLAQKKHFAYALSHKLLIPKNHHRCLTRNITIAYLYQ